MNDIPRSNPTLEFGVCIMAEDPDGMWVTYPAYCQVIATANEQIAKLQGDIDIQIDTIRCLREENQRLIRQAQDRMNHGETVEDL